MDTKALRQKILDLAIRGKLVPQDPNDEPASVLLERIRAQKQQMVKDGKLKPKDIKNDTVIFKAEDNLHYEKHADGTVKCIEDEIPFDVPEGWEWTQLGAIFIHNTGKALNSSNSDGEPYTYITTSNLYWDHFKLDNLKTMYFTDEELDKCTVSKGDLLVCEGGDIGRSAIWNYDTPIRIQNHIHKLRCIVPIAVSLYYYVLYLYKQTGKINGNGIGMQGLSSNRLHSMLVPFPPLAEQQRIVDSIEKYNDIISVLATDIESVKDTIATTKSKILDLAIRGKLVPQDPNDEPASVLLERIRDEKEELIKQGKIKRDKKESVIFKGEDNSYYEKFSNGILKCIDSEVLFDLPLGWSWERLGNITTIERGGSPRPINDYLTTNQNGINWIKIGDTEKGRKYIYETKEKIIPEGIAKSRYVKSGDFLLTNSMSFGRPYILKTDGCIHDGWLVIGNIESIFNQDFLYYALSSTLIYNTLSYHAAGSTVKNLKSNTVKTVLFPIPPLEEQRRIASDIEKIVKTIETIEASLS